MTARDYNANFDSYPMDTRRRRSQTSKSPPPTVGKRSPSPRVAFTATTITTDGKGVKHITRKVIRRLEELGHPSELMELDDDLLEEIEEEEQVEVERALSIGRVCSEPRTQANHRPRTTGATNRHATIVALGGPQSGQSIRAEVKKVDWEIPRKLLHSSIGFFSLYLYLYDGDPKMVILVLWTALSVIIPADVLRLNYPPFARVYERFLGFLMRESEKKTSNGVIWYILGVNFVLSCYPLDVATVAILILSWADTAASTIGRLFGPRTSRLPARLPLLRLPLAPRKSLAGFIAASVTGACIAVGFWGWLAPLREGNIAWTWNHGVSAAAGLGLSQTKLVTAGFPVLSGLSTGGWTGLAALGTATGLISGVAEALDLGSLDDNLTLPIISGGCVLALLKFVGLFSSS